MGIFDSKISIYELTFEIDVRLFIRNCVPYFQMEKVDGEKVVKFVKILLNPGSVSGSLQSLNQDQKKQFVSFYDEMIPQMPKKNLLRMRFEQSREFLTQPDKYSAKDFTVNPEIKKEVLKFFDEMIPKLPENNMVRRGFEIGRDLQTQVGCRFELPCFLIYKFAGSILQISEGGENLGKKTKYSNTYLFITVIYRISKWGGDMLKVPSNILTTTNFQPVLRKWSILPLGAKAQMY